MKSILTRVALTGLIVTGTFGATVAGAVQHAAPALADDNGWHNGDRDRYDDRRWDRDDRRYDRDDRRWDRDHDRGRRWYDRSHGYWRDNLGYWNRSGIYVYFRF